MITILIVIIMMSTVCQFKRRCFRNIAYSIIIVVITGNMYFLKSLHSFSSVFIYICDLLLGIILQELNISKALSFRGE